MLNRVLERDYDCSEAMVIGSLIRVAINRSVFKCERLTSTLYDRVASSLAGLISVRALDDSYFPLLNGSESLAELADVRSSRSLEVMDSV